MIPCEYRQSLVELGLSVQSETARDGAAGPPKGRVSLFYLFLVWLAISYHPHPPRIWTNLGRM